jgi:DnaJ-class molecular chaperone
MKKSICPRCSGFGFLAIYHQRRRAKCTCPRCRGGGQVGTGGRQLPGTPQGKVLVRR